MKAPQFHAPQLASCDAPAQRCCNLLSAFLLAYCPLTYLCVKEVESHSLLRRVWNCEAMIF